VNQSLNNDEVLAVAYQYTYQGITYQVGEFSTEGVAPPNALVLRLLKATITDPRIPLWDLMMKNVYSLSAFQVNREDFRLDLIYNNPTTGVDINYVPRPPIDDEPLLQVLGMDRLDPMVRPIRTVCSTSSMAPRRSAAPSTHRTAGSSSPCWSPLAPRWTMR
jgi:cell surface protein SprA